MQSDWDASAEAWIESLKAGGDFSRVAVLDRPMLAAVRASAAQRVLDVGCGEGRFCRMMAEIVPQVVGLDPTVRLLGSGPINFIEAFKPL
ncbi:MAG: methyltransferase domain-containing protein [Paracoccaceae bacterium]